MKAPELPPPEDVIPHRCLGCSTAPRTLDLRLTVSGIQFDSLVGNEIHSDHRYTSDAKR